MLDFNIDAVFAQPDRISPTLVAEAFLGAPVHGVIAREHVVQIMIPLGNIDDELVTRINRMEITYKGKRMRVDRVNDGLSTMDGIPLRYRSYGFCVPEIKRAPTEDDYRAAKSIMRDIARDYSGSKYAPTSVLLDDEEKRSQEKMVVEAPLGSGRKGSGFAVKTRKELGVK